MTDTRPISLFLTKGQFRIYEDRAKKFGKKVSTFFRAMTTEHLVRKLERGETELEMRARVVKDQDRTVGTRPSDAGYDWNKCSEKVQFKLVKEHAEALRSFASAEGLTMSAYIRSIIEASQYTDYRLKRYFARAHRSSSLPQTPVVGGVSVNVRKLSDLAAVVVTLDAQEIISGKARRWSVSAFEALERIVKEAA